MELFFTLSRPSLVLTRLTSPTPSLRICICFLKKRVEWTRYISASKNFP